MTAFSTVAQEVILHVPAAPIPLAVHAVKKSAINFCRLSTVYRYEIEEFPMIAGISTYDLDIPDNTWPIKVGVMQGREQPIKPTSPEYLDNTDPGWRDKTTQKPTHYYLASDRLRLVYTPSVTAILESNLIVVLGLKQTATELEDTLFERYYDTLVAGAVAYLSNLPDETVANPTKAQMFSAAFSAGVDMAMTEANRENTAKDIVNAYSDI